MGCAAPRICLVAIVGSLLAVLRPALLRRCVPLLLLGALALGLPAAAGAQAAPRWEVERVLGPDPVTMAVSVSHRLVPYSEHVVLARADDYADALTGGPLAAALGAPLLLTGRDSLHEEVADEIVRLRARRVTLLGGPAAISEAVADGIRALNVTDIQRIAGSNRFETAAAVAAVLRPDGAPHAYLARGGDADPLRGWPDAVAVGALAATTRTPILLTDIGSVPASTSASLAALGATRVSVVGGTAAVQDTVDAALAAAGLTTDRLAGDSRFSTSTAIAGAALDAGATPSQTWLVGGGAWAEALVAGPLVAGSGGVMLMTDVTHWESSAARDWLLQRTDGIDKVWLLGALQAIPSRIDFDLTDLVSPPPEPEQGGVVLAVGDDFQSVVDSHPPGTHFSVASGVHRLQMVRPRDGDRFTGQPGAVMSGAQPLDPGAFAARDGLWVLPGQTSESEGLGNPEIELDPGRERDAAEQDLWSGDRRLRHVDSRSAVTGRDTWYFDYAADEIVLAADPATLAPLELAVTPAAFESSAEAPASGVVIEHLTVMRYATRAQHAAVSAADGTMWTIRHLHVTQNHAGGIRTGPGVRVEHSRVTHNGSLGISGTDRTFDGPHVPVRVERNEVAFNRELGYYWMWEGGGIKLGTTADSVVTDNWAHHNGGVGIWCDLGCTGTEISSNRLEGNEHGGIYFELSQGADVFGNLVRGHGALSLGDQGVGLWVSNSKDVRMVGNVMEANRYAFLFNWHNQENVEPIQVSGVEFIGNDVRLDGNEPGYRNYTGRPSAETVATAIHSNRYRVGPGRDVYFFWDGFYDIAGWQGLGFDADAAFVDLFAAADPPYDLATYAGAPVGP